MGSHQDWRARHQENVKIDASYVAKQLAEIAKNQDLSRYIL